LPPAGHEAITVHADSALAWGWDVAAGDVVDPDADWPEHQAKSLGKILASLANQFTD
jgi:hypothetical protein